MASNEIDKILRYLNDNHIYPEEVRKAYFDDLHDVSRVVATISWGDWKHEHLRCDFLMSEIGYVYDGLIETESDGSDCFSADHYYYVKGRS